MAFGARENPGYQSISGWIKIIPFVPLTWRPQWYSLINSIFCHINFAGSVIPNLTDDGVVWNDFVVLTTSLSERRCFGNKS